jgi:hypothetical protein
MVWHSGTGVGAAAAAVIAASDIEAATLKTGSLEVVSTADKASAVGAALVDVIPVLRRGTMEGAAVGICVWVGEGEGAVDGARVGSHAWGNA